MLGGVHHDHPPGALAPATATGTLAESPPSVRNWPCRRSGANRSGTAALARTACARSPDLIDDRLTPGQVGGDRAEREGQAVEVAPGLQIATQHGGVDQRVGLGLHHRRALQGELLDRPAPRARAAEGRRATWARAADTCGTGPPAGPRGPASRARGRCSHWHTARPTTAPMLVPTMRSGRIPRLSRTRSTPMCAMPLAPPPESTSAVRGARHCWASSLDDAPRHVAAASASARAKTAEHLAQDTTAPLRHPTHLRIPNSMTRLNSRAPLPA